MKTSCYIFASNGVEDHVIMLSIYISRVPYQNGVSWLYTCIMLEIHHSGREPSTCVCMCVCVCVCVCVCERERVCEYIFTHTHTQCEISK